MQPTHRLFICTTCASIWKDGKREGKSGGQELIENVTEKYQSWDLREKFSIVPVECMSACSHACAISFSAPGKFTYIFGDLSVKESADAVLECAGIYYSKTDGSLSWSERPEPLKKGIIAKIPPVEDGV